MRPRRKEAFVEPFSRTAYLRLDRFTGQARSGPWVLQVGGSRPARFVVAVGTNETRGEVRDYLPGPEADVGVWFARPQLTGPVRVAPGSPGQSISAGTRRPGDSMPTPGVVIALALIVLALVGGGLAALAAIRRRGRLPDH